MGTDPRQPITKIEMAIRLTVFKHEIMVENMAHRSLSMNQLFCIPSGLTVLRKSLKIHLGSMIRGRGVATDF